MLRLCIRLVMAAGMPTMRIWEACRAGMGISGTDREAAALFTTIKRKNTSGEYIADDGGDGSAAGSHGQAGDQDRIKDDVDHSAADGSDHGFLGQTLRPQQVGVDKRGHDNRRADGQPGIIFAGVGEGLRVRPDQIEDRRPEDQHDDANDHTDHQGNVKTEGAGPSHAIRVLLAKQSGEIRASALTEDVAEGHQQRKDRRAQGDAGHQGCVVGLGHKKVSARL